MLCRIALTAAFVLATIAQVGCGNSESKITAPENPQPLVGPDMSGGGSSDVSTPKLQGNVK
jgi:hypothetical protein